MVQYIMDTNLEAKDGVRPNLFVFNLKDLPNIMRQILSTAL